ncbi:MAG: Ig-like domain-containing protein, partial [Candidatus Nanopelagicales bacterium]
MRASVFVGRVGGLAVVLGIGAAALGTAALGAAAPASAAPAGTTGSSAASDTATQTDSPAAAPRSRAGRSSAASLAQHSARRSADSMPTAAATGKNAVPVPRGITPPVAAVQPQSVDRSAARVVAAPTVDSNPVVAQTVTTTASQTLSTAAAAAPVAGVVGSALTSLLGTDPATPVQSPLSWGVLAVARRESGLASASQVTAKAVTAAANVDPNAALYFNQTPSLSYSINPGQGSKGIVTGVLVGTDVDSPILNYSVVGTPGHGSVAVAADGTFTYTPDASVAATGTVDTFTASISDAANGFHLHGVGGLLNLLSFGIFGGSGHTATTRVTVVVQPFQADGSTLIGTATVGSPDPTTGVVTGSVTTADSSSRLTYSGSTTTTKGAVVVDAATGSFTYTPTSAARHAAAKVGATTAATTDSFTVTVSDANGASVAVPVTVTISPKNTAPVSGTTTVGAPDASTGVVTGTVSATDADSDALTYTAPATTTSGSVTVNTTTGAFVYTPTSTALESVTTDSFTVTAVDGYGGSTPVVVSVPITAKTV